MDNDRTRFLADFSLKKKRYAQFWEKKLWSQNTQQFIQKKKKKKKHSTSPKTTM